MATVLLKSGIAPGDVSLSIGSNGTDLVISIAGTSDSLTIADQFGWWFDGVAQVQFADGTTWSAAQLGQQLVSSEIAAGAATVSGTKNAETFDDSAGNVTLTGGGGADTFAFGHGYGQVTVNEADGNGRQATIAFKSDVSESDVMLTRSANPQDLVISLAGTTDTLTDQSQFGYWFQGVQQLQFADGTTLTSSQLSGLELGTTGDDTLTGTSGNDTFYSSPGSDTMTGAGGSDTYKIGTNVGQTLIDNSASGGTAASGEVDFLSGLSDAKLWFTQSGNNLQVDILGTSKKLTIAGWFGSNASAQIAKFTTADGSVLDTQVAQLVAAMATYSAANPGFDPTTASQMPTDSSLQSAMSAWHH